MNGIRPVTVGPVQTVILRRRYRCQYLGTLRQVGTFRTMTDPNSGRNNPCDFGSRQRWRWWQLQPFS